jgi:hypothetical protein
MKLLLEKLKAIPKKTLVLVGLLVAMSVCTAIMSVMVVSQSKKAQNAQDSADADSIKVFNSTGTQSDGDSKANLDMSDVFGLNFVSHGDGTCTVAGIGTCTKTELIIPDKSPDGDKVTKIADHAFENCKQLVSVSIPAGVKVIGTGAFRGCEALVAINVSSGNEIYSSVGGVLFSKDKTVLLCYPMNRQGTNYLLSTDVKAIGAFAFEGAINLKQLLYSGSVASFSAIEKLNGNDLLDTIAITCNYSGAK